MDGRLADGQLLADVGQGVALGEVGLGLAQLEDDFFRRM
jgi:hypothetical protein